jgi:Domain of unknown function (DUF4411)
MMDKYFLLDTSVFINLRDIHPTVWQSKRFQKWWRDFLLKDNVILLEAVWDEIFLQSKNKKSKDELERFFLDELKGKGKTFVGEESYFRYNKVMVHAYKSLLAPGTEPTENDYLKLNAIADSHLVSCAMHYKAMYGEGNVFVVSEEHRQPKKKDGSLTANIVKAKIPNVCDHKSVQVGYMSALELM